MSVVLEPVLPAPLRALLADPIDIGFTLLVVTVREDGWPHVAMISLGEIVASGEDGVLFALWPASTSTANLTSRREATLTAVVGATSYSLRLDTDTAGDLETASGDRLSCFRGRVAAATSDEAPYAVIESGIRFCLRDPEKTLQRWRQVRAGLARLRLEPST